MQLTLQFKNVHHQSSTMNIRRLLSKSTSCLMDLYSRRLYDHVFDVEYTAAAKFLAKHPQPELSQADKVAIDSYWKQFGILFPDYSWQQMFYGVTGMHDPRFIPDFIAFAPICEYYNDKSSIAGWEDKNLFDHLVPAIKFPPVLAHIYKGNVYDKDWNIFVDDNLDQLCDSIFEQIKDDHSLIIKATKATQTGKGVKLISVEKPDDIKTAIINNRHSDNVVQRRIQQSAFMSQFCSTAVNIFRIITWRHQGKIEVLSASIRYGVEGHFTDVAFIKGEEIVNTVGVNNDGTVNSRFVSLRGNAEPPEHFNQPMVPNYDKIIDMAKQGHKNLFPFDFVGWDITLDQDDIPVCIEFNVRRPGTIVYQFANGPMAGELTDEFLSFLNKDGNLEKYIPKKYRI